MIEPMECPSTSTASRPKRPIKAMTSRAIAELAFPPPAGHGTYAARRTFRSSSYSTGDRYPREL